MDLPPPALVVVRAGNRSFRVPASKLKDRSPVFAGILADPPPALVNMDLGTEEIPEVVVQDDADELKVFLTAIVDDSDNYFAPPPALSEIDIIVAILRLSTKYDVRLLRVRALQHLDTLYATRLEGYSRQANQISFPVESNLEVNLKTIHVAAEVGALWLLPDAYHDMHRESAQEVLAAGELWERLENTEKERCLRSFSLEDRARSPVEVFEFLGFSTGDSTTTCDVERWDGCNSARLAFLQKYDWFKAYNVLELMDDGDWKRLGNKSTGLCSACLKEAKKKYQRRRQKFWDELPGYYGLPGWDQLEEMRQDDLA